MQISKISQTEIGHNLGIRKLKCSDEIGTLHPSPTQHEKKKNTKTTTKKKNPQQNKNTD